MLIALNESSAFLELESSIIMGVIILRFGDGCRERWRDAGLGLLGFISSIMIKSSSSSSSSSLMR
jgi:hypothetical protein